MIWREKKVWLIVLALALAADVFVFVTYRVQFQKRIDDVTERQKETTARLAQAQEARLSAQDTYKRYLKVQSDLDTLYDTKWATQDQRLIPWIKEIKRLAEASQLVPKILNFNKEEAKEKEVESASGLKKSVAAKAVTISYTVEGNYQQVRRLINALELSDQFVIIDTLAVTAAGENTNVVSVNLRLKTLFREPLQGTAEQPAHSTTAATITASNETM